MSTLFCYVDDRRNTLEKCIFNVAERLLSEHLVFSDISLDDAGSTVPISGQIIQWMLVSSVLIIIYL